MHKKNPDPDGFRVWIKRKADTARNACTLGDFSELGRRASDFGISAEDARGILKREGWEIRPTPGGAGRRWHPPEEEGEDG